MHRRRLTFDEIDHRLLENLQRDASQTLQSMGEAVGLSASAVQRRIGRYRSAGVLSGHVAVLAATGMSRHSELADRLFKDAPNVKRYTTMFVLDPLRTGTYLPTR